MVTIAPACAARPAVAQAWPRRDAEPDSRANWARLYGIDDNNN